MTATLQFEAHDVCQLLETIWSVMFGCEARTRCLAADSRRSTGVTTGLVPISGAWNGAVALECPAAVGRQAASVMFDIPPNRITAEQIYDALGELTNIISGNFKTLLPAGSHLGLPTVAEGQDYVLRFPGSQVLVRVAVETSAFPVQVTLLASV